MNPSQINPPEKISVIIPTYNRDFVLKRAIDSVLKQTYENLEVLVVDDGSKDKTPDLMNNYKENKKIKYIRYVPNQGANHARNVGILKSTGKYIAFLDSDDEWLPEKVAIQADILKNSSEDVGAVFSDITAYSIDNKVVNFRRHDCSGWIFNELLGDNVVGTTSTLMIKRECVEKGGLFDETFPACQDWEYWLRLARIFQFIRIKKPLIRYYSQPDSIMRNYNKTLKGFKMLLRKYWKLFDPRTLQSHFSRLSLYHDRNRNLEPSFRCFLLASRIVPFRKSLGLSIKTIAYKLITCLSLIFINKKPFFELIYALRQPWLLFASKILKYKTIKKISNLGGEA